MTTTETIWAFLIFGGFCYWRGYKRGSGAVRNTIRSWFK